MFVGSPHGEQPVVVEEQVVWVPGLGVLVRIAQAQLLGMLQVKGG